LLPYGLHLQDISGVRDNLRGYLLVNVAVDHPVNPASCQPRLKAPFEVRESKVAQNLAQLVFLRGGGSHDSIHLAFSKFVSTLRVEILKVLHQEFFARVEKGLEASVLAHVFHSLHNSSHERRQRIVVTTPLHIESIVALCPRRA